MSLLSRYLDDAYVAWLGAAVQCCSADEKPVRGVEKPMTILHQQPHLVPPPIPEPQRQWSRSKSVSSRMSFSVKRKLNMYNGPRKPQISAPSDFRHVQRALPRRNFRPLELSIYMDKQLSPILPHFEMPSPPQAHMRSDSTEPLLHTRSDSSLSNFTVKRKPISSFPSEQSAGLAELPRARLRRADTEPIRRVDQLERVKSALQEKEELVRQIRDIDSIIEERQSLYIRSRPASLWTSEDQLPEIPEPCPTDIPDIPSTISIPLQTRSSIDASAAFNSHPPSRTQTTRQILRPPLPLVLEARPVPIQKKSFSQVSSWLFPEHTRSISLDAVTNTPKPVTSREGFYKCIDIDMSHLARQSTISVTTVSTMYSTIDEPTVPTWSAQSSPGREKQQDELCKTMTFGEVEKDEGHLFPHEGEVITGACRISRVGVAF